MNEVFISGIIKGEFEKTSRDGIKFLLLNRGKNNNQDEFIALAYGDSAKFLTQHAQSGQRVVVQGRLSSEKLDTQKYHTAVTVSRILSITDSSQGMDFSYAVVSGTAKSNGMTRLNNDNQTAVLNLNVANHREYYDKSKDETQTYTTFIGATLWGNTAEAANTEYSFPMEDVPVVFDGILKARSYEDKESGETVNKVDVWVNNLSVGTQSPASAAPSPRRDESPRKSDSTPARTKPLDNNPF